MSLALSNEAQEILNTVGSGVMSEAFAMRTIVKLVMENQQLRQTLRAVEILEGRPGFGKQEVAGQHNAAIRPKAHLNNVNSTNAHSVLDVRAGGAYNFKPLEVSNDVLQEKWDDAMGKALVNANFPPPLIKKDVP